MADDGVLGKPLDYGTVEYQQLILERTKLVNKARSHVFCVFV